MPLAWVRSPVLAVAASQTYQAAGIWRALEVGSDESKQTYGTLVDAAIDGNESFANKREVIDEYGWRHFGDLYADHEAVNEPGLVSHYNNQYDAVAGFATRFCETGDRRWWIAMRDLAAHVVDIDIYHCTTDRAAYNNGLFWHTSHYSGAHTAGHRSYSRRAGPSSGGPSNEHNYTTGLLLHFFLTGCDASREAVLQLAGWVLDMDDGAKGRFWWIDRGETGLASATREPNYHGPGRGAAYSINALLDAHRLTGESRYLVKAERLVERCIHPTDDPDAMDLLDAERRWSSPSFCRCSESISNTAPRKDCSIDGSSMPERRFSDMLAGWPRTSGRTWIARTNSNSRRKPGPHRTFVRVRFWNSRLGARLTLKDRAGSQRQRTDSSATPSLRLARCRRGT